uniref:RNA-directed DNA polymerase n=1 Tax=Grapevine vein clearing virus TaxID=1050407 RepID=A0A218MH18_9VIRU|nr:polyprotein [Grapevine vein clearing virus]
MSRSRTQTTELPRATRRSTSPVERLDDQIRGYRRMARARYLAEQRIRRSFSRNYRETLERRLDPEAELQLSRRRRANLVPAEVLYSLNYNEPQNRVYQHYEEVRSHVIDRQQDFRFIEEQSYRTLVQEGMQHIHPGMLMVRIQMLHRVDAGISAMIVFRDTRWNDERQIISAMTVDMARGAQLVYAIPDLMMSIHDFYHHLQVSITTRGYGTGWAGGESNLIVTRSLTGRITNTSQANFNYQIEGVADYLASHGVQSIPGQPWRDINQEGSWNLRPSSIQAPTQVPTGLVSRQTATGNISLRFTSFQDQVQTVDTEEEAGTTDTERVTHYALVGTFEWLEECPSYQQRRSQETEENGWVNHVEGDKGFNFKVRMTPPAWSHNPQPITATGWGDDFDDSPPPPKPPKTEEEEILELYPVRRQPDPVQIARKEKAVVFSQAVNDIFEQEGKGVSRMQPSGEAPDSDPDSPVWKIKKSPYPQQPLKLKDEKGKSPFEDLELKQDLVQSWIAQLGSGSGSRTEKPVFDTTSSDSDSDLSDVSSKVLAYAGVEEAVMEYPRRVKTATAKLADMEKAFAGETTAAVGGDSEMTTGQSSRSTLIPPNEGGGPIRYPPAERPSTSASTYNATAPPLFEGTVRPGRYGRPLAPWSLPSAQHSQGALLILPPEVASHADAITTWETITLNHLMNISFDSLQDRVDYIENLLGPREREAWVTWRMAYDTEYRQLVELSGEPRNVTSTIKRVLGINDPYTGTTHIQNQAYADLERLQCKNLESVMPFLNSYFQLAAKSGKMWSSPELSEKLFRKLPPEIGPTIAKEYAERYPGMLIGVNARIQFVSEYLQDLCKQADLQRKLKNLNFCKAIPIPGYYDQGVKKKYGLRKSKTYKGKPHDSHVKVIKNKYKGAQGRKCKCYLCGIEGHYARECPKKHVRPERAAYFEGMGLDVNWDVISVDPGDQDGSDICSISEGEAQHGMEELAAFKAQLPYPVEAQYEQHQAFVVIQTTFKKEDKPQGSWRMSKPIPEAQQQCQHTWDDMYALAEGQQACSTCQTITVLGRRATCTLCLLNLCSLCAGLDFGLKIVPKTATRADWKFQDRDTLIASLYEHNAFLLRQVEGLKQELQAAKEQLQLLHSVDMINLSDDGLENFSVEEKSFLRGGGGTSSSSIKISSTTTPPGFPTTPNRFQPLAQEKLKGIQEDLSLVVQFDNARQQEQAYTEMPRGAHNKLYHVVVTFRIPDVKGQLLEFDINAIIDTGCTCCCINLTKVPDGAIENASIIQEVSGINSKTVVTKKLRQGKMILAGNDFYIPYVSAFEMNMPGIDMLIGCNFIRAMKGGIRLEGTEVTFYKTITRIQTTLEPQKIAYLEELVEAEDLHYELAAASMPEPTAEGLRNTKLLAELKEQGYIGEEPLKHWSKNRVRCKLDIINPDITIEAKPPGHLTLEDKVKYQKHIDALLDLGVIRPSKSRHRSAAFIVASGTSVDPKTGKETRGKERMVIDYRMLNDNCYKDQYSLPGITSIIKSLGQAKIFSKFDLKSGFHQVMMEEESIPWTAFISPAGLYEWLVMPFGIQNAPAIFQRKMDECFKGTEDFIAVYIDDILVFSNSIKEHEKHLQRMLSICKEHGLVLSPTKMKIAVPGIDFLGAHIRNSRVSLQPHIIKKIADKKDDELMTLKGLRSWLGVINYVRQYIPKCGTLLGPLYAKTSEHGDRRWHPKDWEIVRQIKKMVQSLPDLELPPPHAVIIIESDGCMEGWGGICKWKNSKGESKGKERICAYASGKFPTVKSTIDAEIYAVMASLENFKIYYLDKREITIRTDCQAIISFYDKMAVKKPSRVRWINFCDYITNTGIKVQFEHIKGQDNQLADQLSRLAQGLCSIQVIPEAAHEALNIILEQDCTAQELMAQFNSMLQANLRVNQGRPNTTWYSRTKPKKSKARKPAHVQPCFDVSNDDAG